MWNTFRNDTSNSGVSKFVARSINRSTKVSRKFLDGIIWGTCVIDEENNVYVGSSNRRFISIDINGNIRWQYKLTRSTDSLIDSAAALHPSGIVIIPGGDGYIHALNKDTGKLQWFFKAHHVSDDIDNSGVTVNSFEGNVQIDSVGNIYAGNDNCYLYSLDSNGKERWSFKTNMMIWGCVGLIYNEKYVIVNSLDNYVYMIESSTGKLVTKYETNAEIKTSPLILGSKCVVSNCNGMVYFFETINGKFEVLWSHDFGKEIYSSPACKNNILVIAITDGNIIGIDILTGNKIWTKTFVTSFCSSPIISEDNIVIIGSKCGKLYTFDLALGELIGYYDTTQYYKLEERYFRKNLNASPALDKNGIVHIGGYDGYLYSIPIALCNSKEIHEIKKPLNTVYSESIKQFRFIIKGNQNAVLNASSISYDKNIPYEIVTSSDGKYLNFIPNSINGLDKEYTVKIKGKYFNQTNSWIKDRFKIFGQEEFSDTVILPALQYKKTKLSDMKKNSIIYWDTWDMFSTQPRILDTYIPAAMQAMAYTSIAFGFYNKQNDPKKYFKILMIPSLTALDDSEEFLYLNEPEKILFFDAYYYEGFIFATCNSQFTLSAMGGTIPFEKFNIYSYLDDDYSFKSDFYAVSSCMNIKGNGENYKFSSEIVNQLCDSFLKVKSIGCFKGKYKKAKETDVAKVYTSNKIKVILNEGISPEKFTIIIVEFNNNNYGKVYKFNKKEVTHNKISGYSYIVLVNDMILTLLIAE